MLSDTIVVVNNEIAFSGGSALESEPRRLGAAMNDRAGQAAILEGEATRDAVEPGRVDLDVLGDHVGYLIRRVQLWIFQDFERTLASVDIRPAEYSVLCVVGANPGLPQTKLAETLGIERARLVRLLDGLEARNLAKRVPSASDRRSHELHLTREGEAFLVQLKALAREHEDHVEQRLGTKGRRDLLALLQRFLAA
jgi:DNA-binding MarR family transcriptional regulator